MSKMVKHFAGASLALVLLCGNALAAGNEVRLPVEKAARPSTLGELKAAPAEAKNADVSKDAAKDAAKDTIPAPDAKKPEAKPAAKPAPVPAPAPAPKPAPEKTAPVKPEPVKPEAVKPEAGTSAPAKAAGSKAVAAKPEAAKTEALKQDALKAAAMSEPNKPAKPAPVPTPAAKAKPAPKPEAKPKPKPTAAPTGEPTVTPTVTPDSKPEGKPEPKLAPAPAPKPKPAPVPAPVPVPVVDPKALETPQGPSNAVEPVTLPTDASAGLLVGDIRLEFQPNQVVVHVATNAPVERVTHFNMAAPRKLALDLRGQWRKKGGVVLRYDTGPVKVAVVGEHPDRLRLSLEFRQGAVRPEVSPVVEPGPTGVKLTIPLAR